MAKQVKAFEANDGSLHKDKVQAAERDVRIVMEKIFQDELSPRSVDGVTKSAIEHREDLIRVLSDYHRVAPPPPKASASQEKQKGPVSKIKVMGSPGEVIEIPPGYWFDGTVFRETIHDGESTITFYDEWYSTRFLFPHYKEDACSAMNAEPDTVHDFRGQH